MFDLVILPLGGLIIPRSEDIQAALLPCLAVAFVVLGVSFFRAINLINSRRIHERASPGLRADLRGQSRTWVTKRLFLIIWQTLDYPCFGLCLPRCIPNRHIRMMRVASERYFPLTQH